MNSWNFTGNTGGDAITKFLASGDAITSFSVAVKAGYGKNEVTSWVNCSIYGKRGESVSPLIKKGALIGITGEGLLRTWDKDDGSKGSSLEVRVNDVTLLGGKQSGESVSQQPKTSKANEQKPHEFDGEDDPLPF